MLCMRMFREMVLGEERRTVVSYYTNGSFMAMSFGFPVAARHRSTHGERTLQTLAGRWVGCGLE